MEMAAGARREEESQARAFLVASNLEKRGRKKGKARGREGGTTGSGEAGKIRCGC